MEHYHLLDRMTSFKQQALNGDTGMFVGFFVHNVEYKIPSQQTSPLAIWILI